MNTKRVLVTQYKFEIFYEIRGNLSLGDTSTIFCIVLFILLIISPNGILGGTQYEKLVGGFIDVSIRAYRALPLVKIIYQMY